MSSQDENGIPKKPEGVIGTAPPVPNVEMPMGLGAIASPLLASAPKLPSRPPTKSELWHSLVERVAEGSLSPEQAERHRKILELDALSYTPNPKDYDPRDYSEWTFTMALAWIVTRDYNEVREHWNQFRVRHAWWEKLPTPKPNPFNLRQKQIAVSGYQLKQREPVSIRQMETSDRQRGDGGDKRIMSFDDAYYGQFTRSLEEGELVVSASIISSGNPIEVNHRHWVRFELAEEPHGMPFYRIKKNPSDGICDPHVRRDDMIRLWPEVVPVEHEPAKPKKKHYPEDEIDAYLKTFVDAYLNDNGPQISRDEDWVKKIAPAKFPGITSTQTRASWDRVKRPKAWSIRGRRKGT